MKYCVTCKNCHSFIWVRGHYEYDTNATVLDDNDKAWSEGCEHIQSGEYDVESVGDEDEF